MKSAGENFVETIKESISNKDKLKEIKFVSNMN